MGTRAIYNFKGLHRVPSIYPSLLRDCIGYLIYIYLFIYLFTSIYLYPLRDYIYIYNALDVPFQGLGLPHSLIPYSEPAT